MPFYQRLSLEQLGWKPLQELALTEQDLPSGRIVARVMAGHRDRVIVHGPDFEGPALISNRLAEMPAVGDWVVVDPPTKQDDARVASTLPRTSQFVRKAAGGEVREQVVAANVDEVWLVCGLPDDFNVRRLERYLSLAWNSGAIPRVVLTKADLVDDPEGFVRDAERVSPGVEVVAVSALTGDGNESLNASLKPGWTIALLGSSGAGKSTLINHLCGRERFKTTEVRADDGKGRHTTTHREIVPLENGALLMDTPGMRELGLWSSDEGRARAFADVEQWAINCRFSDCTHSQEPGCAVVAACESGELDPERLASYQLLQAEQRRIDRQADALARREDRRSDRVLHKLIRQRVKSKR